jgi:hypothetical protein
MASNNNNNNKSNEQKTYRQAAGEYYNQKYETWMPWIEDKYLSWFTKDNKASYATKRTSATSVTLLYRCICPALLNLLLR